MTFRLLCIFLFVQSQLFAQSLSVSNLPILQINTKGATIVDEPKIPAKFTLFDRGKGQLNQLTDKPTFVFWAGIEYRGSSSQGDWYFLPGLVKKPYGFEIWADSLSMAAVKLPIAQFGAESDWVLNASYNDRTFLRDVLAQQLASQFGLQHSKTRYVEVILNDAYQGIYVLMEKIKQGGNRLDIADLTPTDNAGDAVTGGYLVKIDKTSGAVSRNWNSAYVSGKGTEKSFFQIEYPKSENITNQQFTYIKNYVNTFEKSLQEEQPLKATTTYRSMMDMPSFVNYFLLNELSRNVDGFRLSTYFYKDKDSKGGKLTMGPAWDYNLSFGNADYYDGYLPQGWVYNKLELTEGTPDYFQTPFWWGKLMKDSVFVNSVKRRWSSLRKTTLTPQAIFKFMDSTTVALKDPMQRNFGRFPLYGKKVWPNYYVGNNANEELFWMENWISARITWLDAAIARLDATLILGNESEVSIRAFPNPATQSIQLEFPLQQNGNLNLEIFDLLGRSVLKKALGAQVKGPQLIPVDISALAPSRYVIAILQDDAILYRFPIVKSLD
ncbi:MAG: CotH kinase family protein [Cytophagaceae bacterium]|nr:CotH kinase family protein [Cytophagaceae bacterium]